MKLKKPDTLPILSESLRALIAKLANDGCPIARTITDALSQMHRINVRHPFYRANPHTYGCTRNVPWAFAIFNPSPIGSHFSHREKDGMVSYCPQGRCQQFTESGAWKREGRVEIKPAKFVRALIHPRLARRYKDHQFAKFAEKFSHREQEGKLSFSFASFEDGYDEEKYPGGKIESCMWGENVGPFYRSYGAKCLVAQDKTGAFVARAVFWPAANIDGQDVPVLDRIYAESPDITEAMISHARENGYWCKVKQSRMEKDWWMKPDGTTTHLSATIEQVKNFTGSFYPYMDTFTYMDESDCVLANHETSGCAELCNTNGELDRGGIECEDGIRRPEDECVEVDGSWYWREDSDIVCCADGEYRLIGDCFCCHRSEEYYPNSEGYSIELSRHETIYIHRDHVYTLE